MEYKQIIAALNKNIPELFYGDHVVLENYEYWANMTTNQIYRRNKFSHNIIGELYAKIDKNFNIVNI